MYRSLIRLAIVAANDVFPDPGMPLMAIMSRDVSGVDRSLAR